jgi:hypothetical protein
MFSRELTSYSSSHDVGIGTTFDYRHASQVIPAERPIKLLMEILLNGFIMTT